MKESNFKRSIKSAEAASIGLTLVASVAIGFFAGIFLDKIFSTSPYITLILFLFGLLAGLYSVIKLVIKLKNANK